MANIISQYDKEKRCLTIKVEGRFYEISDTNDFLKIAKDSYETDKDFLIIDMLETSSIGSNNIWAILIIKDYYENIGKNTKIIIRANNEIKKLMKKLHLDKLFHFENGSNKTSDTKAG